MQGKISALPGLVLRSIFILLIFCTLYSGIREDSENSIYNFDTKIDSISHHIFQIPDPLKSKISGMVRQKFFREKLHVWTLFDSDSLYGIGVLDNVIGKSMPITFLVVFNLEGLIIHSEIIKYREPYGGEVSSRNWLRQFYTKYNNSSFKVGKEIDGISGATISVNSVSRGIHKLALLVPEIIKIYSTGKE